MYKLTPDLGGTWRCRHNQAELKGEDEKNERMCEATKKPVCGRKAPSTPTDAKAKFLRPSPADPRRCL